MLEKGTKIRFIAEEGQFEAWSPTKANELLKCGDIVTVCEWNRSYDCPEYMTAMGHTNIIMKPYWEVVKEEAKPPCSCKPSSLLLFGCQCGAHS